LPDGLFSNQKSQFGKILEDLAMEEVGLFYGHLVYFMWLLYFVAIWQHVMVIFGMLYQEKSGNHVKQCNHLLIQSQTGVCYRS
jgi:hypothetical protein